MPASISWDNRLQNGRQVLGSFEPNFDHEAMCEERSKTIFNRLENIDNQLAQMQRNMFLIGFTLISGMAGLIITLTIQ